MVTNSKSASQKVVPHTAQVPQKVVTQIEVPHHSASSDDEDVSGNCFLKFGLPHVRLRCSSVRMPGMFTEVDREGGRHVRCVSLSTRYEKGVIEEGNDVMNDVKSQE